MPSGYAINRTIRKNRPIWNHPLAVITKTSPDVAVRTPGTLTAPLKQATISTFQDSLSLPQPLTSECVCNGDRKEQECHYNHQRIHRGLPFWSGLYPDRLKHKTSFQHSTYLAGVHAVCSQSLASGGVHGLGGGNITPCGRKPVESLPEAQAINRQA